jgi:hypothetical protein
LGRLCYDGRGLAKDEVAAIARFQKAADQLRNRLKLRRPWFSCARKGQNWPLTGR